MRNCASIAEWFRVTSDQNVGGVSTESNGTVDGKHTSRWWDPNGTVESERSGIV